MRVILAPTATEARSSVPGGRRSASMSPTCVVCSSGSPQRAATNVKVPKAKSMFMITPAEITIVRAHMGLESKSRELG
jgi:hypothetical protein